MFTDRWPDPDASSGVTRKPTCPPSVSEESLVHEMFLRRVDEFPSAPAVRSGDTTLTYADLEMLSRLLSGRLPRGVSIAVLAEPGPDLIISILAVLRAGSVYVPLDPSYPLGRLKTMTADSGAQHVIVGSSVNRSGPLVEGMGLPVIPVRQEGTPSVIQSTSGNRIDGRAEATAYIVYTSGTTGTPKGIEMGHAALAQMIQWQVERSAAGEGSRTLQFAGPSFDVSMQEIFSTLASGGCLVPVDRDTRRNPQRLLEHIANHEIDRIFLPYVALQTLADAAQRSGVVPSCLREVMTAGEQLVVTDSIRWFFESTRASLDNQYGPSETFAATANLLAGSPKEWRTLPSIGWPVPHAIVTVVDGDGKRCPPGETGTIMIEGGGLAKGYRHGGDRGFGYTPEGGRRYLTGDRAVVDEDGSIQFLGRDDDQLKIRGMRVEPGEVEAHILSHPDVVEAVAGVHAGDHRLAAYYVLSSESQTAAREILENMRQGLPGHMIPSILAAVSQLPRTPTGKADRKAVFSAAVTAVPALDREDDRAVRESRDSTEAQLVEIWTDALKTDVASIDDDFFDLGGDSLTAVRIVANIQDLLGVKLDINALLDAPTVAEQASLVRVAGGSRHRGPAVRLQRGDGKNPIYAFPALPGNVMCYLPLARAIGSDQTMWAFHSPGLEAGESFLDSVELMADYFLSCVRKLHPGGPWNLIGYSMGGVIAVEVARRLGEAGEVVNVVGLLDSDSRADPVEDAAFVMEGLLHVGGRLFGSLQLDPIHDVDMRELIKLPESEQISRLLQLAKSAGTLPQDYDYAALGRMLTVRSRNLTAVVRHTIRHYPGRVIHFTAEHRPSHWRDSREGWPEIADEFVNHVVPGNHLTMISPENCGEIAEHLRRYVRGHTV